MDPKTTRGYLNCNPGNMDRGEPPWNGEIRPAPGGVYVVIFPDQRKVVALANDVQRAEFDHGRFCVFVDSAHGIRALVHNLWAYRDRLGCRTIRHYIVRWAPPNENNTGGYVARVAAEARVDADAPVDINQRSVIRALVNGIVNVECAGMPYEAHEIEEGLTLAGVAA